MAHVILVTVRFDAPMVAYDLGYAHPTYLLDWIIPRANAMLSRLRRSTAHSLRESHVIADLVERQVDLTALQ